MRINKYYILIFIFISFMLVTPNIGNPSIVDSTGHNQADLIKTDQIQSGPPQSFDLNASVTYMERNITVQKDAKILFEDDMTIVIHDNVTKLSSLNYSLPTEFTKFTQEVKFYVQHGSSVALTAPENLRPYNSKFVGTTITTFNIDITNDSLPVTDETGATYVHARLVTLGGITFSQFAEGQSGNFTSPIVPVFPNLAVDNAHIGFTFSGDLPEGYEIDAPEKLTNKLGAQMPTLIGGPSLMEYSNMSSEPLDFVEGMTEGEHYEEIMFAADTPSGTLTQTGVAPYTIYEATRHFKIDQWGGVYVREEIGVEHTGAGVNRGERVYENVHQLNKFKFAISSDAVITDVYDNFGSIELKNRDDNGNVQTQQAGEKVTVDIDFRNPIYGGDRYKFTIEYEYNASSVVGLEEGYTIVNASLFSDFNVTVQNMEVHFELPSGSTFVNHSYSPTSNSMQYSTYTQISRDSLSSLRHLEYVIEITNANYVDNHNFQIYYRSSAVGYFNYLISFFALTAIILGFIYFLSSLTLKPSKAVEIEREQIPVDKIETFFNLFREKSGAQKRIMELRDKRKKGKISKVDYTGQVKAIKRRLRDINPQLEAAAKDLSKEGGRYERFVSRVMLANQKQADIRRNQRNAVQAHRRGETPKKIFQKLMHEYRQELDKQESTINRTLTEMLELIQQFNQ